MLGNVNDDIDVAVLFYRRHMVGRGEKSVIDMLAQQHADQHEFVLVFRL